MEAQLVLENVGVRLPSRTLFEDVNWTLYEGMRVTLAGRNGSGKSTLLKILAGTGESTIGTRTVVGGKRLRIGMLDQSLLDSAVVSFQSEGGKTISPVNFLEKKLSESAKLYNEDWMEDSREWEIRKILSGLGFSDAWMERPMAELSGGWLLRVFVAKALLEKPQVLLLDEPTNHLDISSIQWLEEFLEREYKGSLVLITHDVALQRRVTDSLAVIHGGKFFFRKNQSDYLTFKESLGDEKIHIEKHIESLQKKIDENMDFFMRFRAKANTANRAQSKLKAAEALQEEQRELKERLNRISGSAFDLRFKFRHSGAGGKFPLAAEDVWFRYAEHAPWIIKNVRFDISRGQRVAIMGDNGAGKTTLLNALAGRFKLTKGEIKQGHAVQIGYFGQHQLDELDLEGTVIDNLRERASGVSHEELRAWLGAFGFGSDDEIQKKSKVLSGGERARLALLRILATRINVCLLDEPTNHLDIETKELLKNAIKDFEGTILMVSHDRDFVSSVADRILYMSNDHELTDHIGNLESFFEKYPQFVRHLEGTRAKPSKADSSNSSVQAAELPKLSYEERKAIRNQTRSAEKKIAQLESEIEKFGVQKAELQKKGDASKEFDKALFDQIEELERQIGRRTTEWEKLTAELDVLKAKVGKSD
jgi:ATP-binding cassette subfamily F protein 3